MLKKAKADILGINVNFPFVWPLDENGKSGSFSAEHLKFKESHIGLMSGTLVQSGIGLNYDGEVKSELLPDLKMDFSGTSSFSSPDGLKSKLKFCMNYEAEEDVSLKNAISIFLGELKDAFGEILFSGSLNASGDFTVSAGRIDSNLKLLLKDSNINLEDKDLSFSGVNLKLDFVDLLKIKTLPNQYFNFKSLKFGSLYFGESTTNFQLESAKSVLLEKGIYSWCGGHVYIHSMRINPAKEQYKILLFCDRLSLAEVLNQLGAAKAEGTGTVNGIITVDICDNKIDFKDSVLYSSPGNGGNIKLAGTELITQGIPKGTEQYHQLELAREALSNFNYEWVRLYMTTEGKDCLLKLNLFGKPAKPLSFEFEKKVGKKSEVRAKGGKMSIRPMRLDLNLRIPLNEILSYKAGFDGFLDRFNK